MEDKKLSALYDKWNEINNEKLSLYYDNKTNLFPLKITKSSDQSRIESFKLYSI